MNLTQMMYALAVARHRNISKAAASLFISQPALSLQIKKLEEEQRGKGITLGPLSFAKYFGIKAIPIVPESYLSMSFVCLQERMREPEFRLLKNYLLRICRRLENERAAAVSSSACGGTSPERTEPPRRP